MDEHDNRLHRFWLFAAVLVALLNNGLFASAAVAESTAEQDEAYTQVITGRAEKIVAELGVADAAKARRVRDLLVQQYRSLSQLHDAGEPEDATAIKLFEVHRRFLARLEAELTPEQVERIKDGMTYGVLQITYRRYLELLPELSAEQKSEILANLIEAREYAMDAGSAEEKHKWFGKYKGRINNYLSAAGYDLKQAEQEWAEKQKAVSRSIHNDHKN